MHLLYYVSNHILCIIIEDQEDEHHNLHTEQLITIFNILILLMGFTSVIMIIAVQSKSAEDIIVRALNVINFHIWTKA